MECLKLCAFFFDIPFQPFIEFFEGGHLDANGSLVGPAYVIQAFKCICVGGERKVRAQTITHDHPLEAGVGIAHDAAQRQRLSLVGQR